MGLMVADAQVATLSNKCHTIIWQNIIVDNINHVNIIILVLC